MDHAVMPQQWESAGVLFKTLSSPLRIGVVLALVERPHTVTELVGHLGVSQPLVSQHLRVLREHCLVQTKRRGREVTYSLMDAHVAHIVRDAVAHVAEHDPAMPTDEHEKGIVMTTEARTCECANCGADCTCATCTCTNCTCANCSH